MAKLLHARTLDPVIGEFEMTHPISPLLQPIFELLRNGVNSKVNLTKTDTGQEFEYTLVEDDS